MRKTRQKVKQMLRVWGQTCPGFWRRVLDAAYRRAAGPTVENGKGTQGRAGQLGQMEEKGRGRSIRTEGGIRPVVFSSAQCLREARCGGGPPISCGGARRGALPQQLHPWRFPVSNQPSHALVCALVSTQQALSGLPG